VRYLLPVAAALLLPLSASAQQPSWNGAPVVEVQLSSFDFTPSTIQLPAGKPVVLRLVNKSGGGHNFQAPQFFSASVVREADRAVVGNGTIELSGGATTDIGVVPAAGSYRLKCTHTMHATFGMTGRIVVE